MADIRFAVLAADTALFTIRDRTLLVRTIRVERPPHFPDNPGLPGGLIAPEETAQEAAKRHVGVKAGIVAAKCHFEQLYTFSEVDRDPRGRVVAVAYLALVPWEKLSERERGSEAGGAWVAAGELHQLAYDHDEILEVALARLRSRLRYTTLISKLMPHEFTLTELEQAYETILGKDLDKRNFRKKILKVKVLEELAKKRVGGPFRPAQLYRFVSSGVRDIEVL
jgi:8-oxo-dGTP diphosphatase